MKAGDPVRVEAFDAVVASSYSEDSPNVLVHGPEKYQTGNISAYVPQRLVSAREPEYEMGEVYRDANGVFVLCDGHNWRDFSGDWVAYDFPPRPLTKLVPEDDK